MKKRGTKLSLKTETLYQLQDAALDQAEGGKGKPTNDCPQSARTLCASCLCPI